jgi:hypothetical protein
MSDNQHHVTGSPNKPIIIPERVSSLNEGKKEMKRRRAEHKTSQMSLNSLLDVTYWDHEEAIRTIDLEEAELCHEYVMKEGVTKYRSADDLVQAETNFASKKVRITEDIHQARQQRGRLENLLERAEDLRMSRYSYAELVTMLALGEFNCGPRDRTTQSAFRKLLIREHNAKCPDGEGLWCPVMGGYLPPELVSAAHIFPYNLGEKIMMQVFGDQSANELFSARNGLLLTERVERKFDSFLLVIVPVDPKVPGRWKIRILDKSIRKQKIWDWDFAKGVTFGDIDHKELQFKGFARPAARYLYFHYTIAVMTASRKGSTDGWLQEMGENCWATPGAYLRSQMLSALMETIGHSVPESSAVEELQQHTICDEKTPVLEDKMAAKLVIADLSGELKKLMEKKVMDHEDDGRDEEEGSDEWEGSDEEEGSDEVAVDKDR